MKRNTDRNAITAEGGIAERGLPSVRYRPAAAATLMAAVVVLLVLLVLLVAGVLNVTNFATNQQGNQGATMGAIFCGLLTLLVLVGTGYFSLAVVKGVRDLGARVYYTRGCIPEGDRGGRRNSWLVIEPEYAGPEMERATRITDEQKAASVDRAQIFQPRFAGPADRKRDKDDVGEVPVPGGSRYLTPERIAANSMHLDDLEKVLDENKEKGSRVLFRIDFASKVKFQPGEEVLVAHSPYLQHVFYVARLKDGEWETYRNRSLI